MPGEQKNEKRNMIKILFINYIYKIKVFINLQKFKKNFLILYSCIYFYTFYNIVKVFIWIIFII